MNEFELEIEMQDALQMEVEMLPDQFELEMEMPTGITIQQIVSEMRIASTDTSSVYEVITGALDNSNTDFTLPGAYISGKLVVYYNGNQETKFTELDNAAGTFRMQFTPADDAVITATWS
ncbi:MAG: hypothetical protein ACEQSL_00695 [Sediminibacterium sp.]